MDNSPGEGDRVCRSDYPGPGSMWPFPSGSSEACRFPGRKEGLL